MKRIKTWIAFSIPTGVWLFTNWFAPGYYFDHDSLAYVLYVSFFNDLVFPFSLYFIFCLADGPICQLRPWWIKSCLAFSFAAVFELGQFIYHLLPNENTVYIGSFDWLDFIAYAGGALLAALVELCLLARLFPFWQESEVLQPARL